jgi:hypothetical protein
MEKEKKNVRQKTMKKRKTNIKKKKNCEKKKIKRKTKEGGHNARSSCTKKQKKYTDGK